MTSVIDGLASGLDTTSIIANLMRIEAAPQTRLKTKVSEADKLVSALQSLNTKVASLATAAQKAASASSWQVSGVTSSSTAVTARTTSAAVPTSVQLRVDRLAAAQVSLVDPATAALGDPPTLTIVHGGELVTVTAAASDALSLAAAINAAGTGVAAVPIRVGDSGGTPEYRLQLSGPTGAAGTFEVYVGDEATVSTYVTDTGSGYLDNGTAPAGDHLVDSTTALVAAVDAQVTLWPDAAGTPLTATSATNTFEDVVRGVTFTVEATTTADPAPVTLSVAADRDAQRALVSETVTALADIFAEVRTQTAGTTTTGSDGRTVVSGGLFSGDSTIRRLVDNLRAQLMDPVDEASPSSIGISVDRYGELTFDAEAFDSAMADDPVGTQAMAAAIAQRVADVAGAASDSIDGSLTMRITSEQATVTDLNRQIGDWDRRLEVRRATLETQYTALEVALSRLQSQSTWLTSQLAGLDNLAAGNA